jgi:hypothetical protein
VADWSLLRKHPELRDRILSFAAAVFSPEQVLEMKKTDTLQKLFVPIQQRFAIGKYAERVDWRKRMVDAFRERLESLHPGDHLTYIANIPEGAIRPPSFFSAGTKPHQETHWILQTNRFPSVRRMEAISSSRATRGENTYRRRGLHYVGRGKKTTLITANAVVDASTASIRGINSYP